MNNIKFTNKKLLTIIQYFPLTDTAGAALASLGCEKMLKKCMEATEIHSYRKKSKYIITVRSIQGLYFLTSCFYTAFKESQKLIINISTEIGDFIALSETIKEIFENEIRTRSNEPHND